MQFYKNQQFLVVFMDYDGYRYIDIYVDNSFQTKKNAK